MEHLKTSSNQLPVQALTVALEADMAARNECEICLEDCQKDEMEEHREMCMERLLFRCTICDGDYMSKEGLWNHLELHEIADEIKKSHYQELKATYRLRQCTLCNDQRGYQEDLYWKHVNEEHDGFFVRCAECGESFRSQKLNTDHYRTTHCKATKQTEIGSLEVDQKFSDKFLPMQNENTVSLVSCGEMNENTAIQLKQLKQELYSVPLEDTKCSEINVMDQQVAIVPENKNYQNDNDSRLSECLDASSNVGGYTDNNMTKKEFEVIPIAYSKSKSETKVTLVDNPSGGSSEIDKRFTCEFCGQIFKTLTSVNVHIGSVHHIEGDLRNIQTDSRGCIAQQQKQADQITLKMEITIEETTLLLHDNVEISRPIQSTITDFPDFNQHPKDQKAANYEHPSEDFNGQQLALTQERKSEKFENFDCTSVDLDIVDPRRFADGVVQITLKDKNSLLQHDHRGKSTPNQSTVTDCPDLSQHAEIPEVIDPEPFSVNCNGQKTALTQVRRTDTHKEMDSPNASTCSDREKEDFRLIENSPAKLHSASDTIKVTKKKPKMHPTITMKGSNKTKAKTKNASQPLVDKPSKTSSDKKCSHCGKECSSVYALTRHIEGNHVPHTCDVCGVTFSGLVKARYHKKRKHTEAKFKCPHCPLKFHFEINCQKHFRRCGSKKFACELCDQKFKSSDYVVRHMRHFHKMYGALKKVLINRIGFNEEHEQTRELEQDRQSCGDVNLIQGENMDLKMEIQVEETKLQEQELQASDEDHGKSPKCASQHKNRKDCLPDPSRDVFQHTPEQPAEISSNPQPSTSRYGEKRSRSLRRTRSSPPPADHTNTSSEASDFSIEESSWEASESSSEESSWEASPTQKQMKGDTSETSHTEPSIKCPDCEKLFFYKSELQRHMGAHLKTKQKKLRDCPKVSVQQSNGDQEQNQNSSLQTVVSERLNHKKENQIKEDQSQACSICGLNIFGNMDHHKRTTHTEPTHKCSHCPKMFYGISKLNRHEGMHSKNERNVACKLCPRSFRDAFTLQRHEYDAHPPSELPCSMCDLKFSTHSKLTYHVNTIHKPQRFKCPECDKSCHAQFALRKHMAVHSKTTKKKHTSSGSKRHKSAEKGEKPTTDDSQIVDQGNKRNKPSSELRRSNRMKTKE